jgi:O-antigen/teichoic acid export membrane protein
LKQIFKSKSEFSRNVLTLMTGTTIAQSIPIAISPILTRIYTPEDFGLFALFMAITSIFASITNGRYGAAIMLPRYEKDAINILALGFIITVIVSSILFILVYFFNTYFTGILKNEEIGVWLYFMPITVFFTGFFNLLVGYNNRKKQYKDIANANILKSIVLVIIQLIIGFVKNGASGLILGQIISNIFVNMKLLKNIIKNKELLSNINVIRIIANAKRYKKFPIYSLPAILANTLSHQLINIFISSFYTISTLGFYALVQRVLGVPTSLIGSSIGRVFFQEATKEKQRTGLAIITFKNIILKLILISSVLFGLFYFIAEDIFAFLFGEEWRVAGSYAQIATPMFAVRFVVSVVSPIDSIMEKQNIFLIFNIVLLFASTIFFLLFKELDFTIFLLYLSIIVSIVYFIYGFILYKMAKNEFHFWSK